MTFTVQLEDKPTGVPMRTHVALDDRVFHQDREGVVSGYRSAFVGPNPSPTQLSEDVLETSVAMTFTVQLQDKPKGRQAHTYVKVGDMVNLAVGSSIVTEVDATAIIVKQGNRDFALMRRSLRGPCRVSENCVVWRHVAP